MKLLEWALQQGVSYQTAWRWVKNGKMPVPVRRVPSGTWIVEEPPQHVSAHMVAYCRVSSAEQKADLDRQVAGRLVRDRQKTDHPRPGETTDDLVRDMTDAFTSLCARLYGQPAAKNCAARAIATATADED